MASRIRRFFSSDLAYNIGDWAVLISIFAFAGSLSKWSSISTRPFLILSLKSVTFGGPSVSGFSIGAPSYPYFHDTVSNTALLLVSILVPFAFVICYSFFLNISRNGLVQRVIPEWRLRGQLINLACLGVATSIAFTLLITEGLKSLVGKQRPDFMGRCDGIMEDLVEQYTSSTMGDSRMVTWEVCKSYWVEDASESVLTKTLLKEGWRSFPSGHASLSFAGMTYLSLYLASVCFRLSLIDLVNRSRERERGCKSLQKSSTSGPSVAILLIVGTPILAAGYIGTSRYSDLKHEGIDIFCGALIGIVGAIVGWNWYGVRHVQLLPSIYESNKKDDDNGVDGSIGMMLSRPPLETRQTDSSVVSTDVDVIQVVIDRKDP